MSGPVLFGSDFEAKIPDLFVTEDNSKIEIIENLSFSGSCLQHACMVKSNNKTNKMRSVSSLDELNATLEKKQSPGFSRVFILYRFNSWSRLNITIEMFRSLYTANQIHPHFLKIVMGLGRKLRSWDEDFMVCYSRFSASSSASRNEKGARRKNCSKGNISKHNLSDLCYNIRHFERHGRELEDPWSCRQSAIHQKYDINLDQSSWTIIQPPMCFVPSFNGNNISNSCHPMCLHIYYLTASVAGWREYLNYIAGRLKALLHPHFPKCKQKNGLNAFHSSVFVDCITVYQQKAYNGGTHMNNAIAICKPYQDFGISFSSKQQIHNFRQKLHHSRSILRNTMNTLSTIGIHEERTAKLCSLPASVHRSFQQELENISSELRNYKQTTHKLLHFSKDILFMYDDILKYHGQELLHSNGLKLTQIAQNDSCDTKTMTCLAEKTYQDSRTTRIATVIAMFYLPANLVTSFFSTTLVWFDSDSGGQDVGEKSSVLRIHRETWIVVLSTFILIACTTFTSWWWDRRERKLVPYQVERL